MVLVCSICNKKFVNQSNVNKHLKSVHKILSKNVNSHAFDNYNHKCLEGCNVSFRYVRELQYHLQSAHNMDMGEEEMKFSTIADFNAWYSNICEENNIQYVKYSEKSKNGEVIVYYNCNRSGKSPSKNEQRQRAEKKQGSCKINLTCTSQIVLKKNDHNYTAMYYKTHYGHSIQLEHIRIPKEDRLMMATKLESGVAIEKVLDSTRENTDIVGVRRVNLITRKDLLNIKQAFHCKKGEGKKHNEYSVNLELWVEELQNSEHNFVLLYKKQGENLNDLDLQEDDFCLIIMNKAQEHMLKRFGSTVVAIDNTHALNSYDFHLTTLMVLDEHGEGFPSAYMISNRQDTVISQLFFSVIKKEVGQITAKVIMSDITDIFYNAWRKVMGTPKHRLLCSWHVDYTWKNYLNKINNLEKRVWVYKTIKYLQTTLDQNDFNNGLESSIKLFMKDKDTEKFGKYFSDYYSKNVRMWAYCYRKECGLNKSMHVESMHNTVTNFSSEGTSLQRLEKGLHAVMSFIRDKVLERVIENMKGQSNPDAKKILSRHRTALASSFEVELTLKSGVYKINCGEQSYLIKKKLNRNCCNLTCQYCNICVHSYSCECSDFYVHNTICKHIHLIAQIKEIDDKQSNNYNNHNDSEELANSSGMKHETLQIKTRINSILNMIDNEIDGFVTNNDGESLEKVLDFLIPVKPLLNNCKKRSNTVSTVKEKLESPRKKIEKQTFPSAKKKRKIDENETLMIEPTTEEKNDIRAVLFGEN